MYLINVTKTVYKQKETQKLSEWVDSNFILQINSYRILQMI